MAIGIANTMYEREKRTQGLRATAKPENRPARVDHLTFRKLRDGNQHTIRDDGPFPEDTPQYQDVPPNGARQHLLWVCRQRDHDGLPEYFSEKYVAPIYDSTTGVAVEIPSLVKADGSPSYWADAIRAQMAAYVAERNARELEAAAEIARMRQSEEDKAAGALDFIVKAAAKAAKAEAKKAPNV
jgi:hypothetical protein